MKQTDFMNKIIDARCYFTSKCKISPRVICFIQIFLPQLHFGQGVICCDALEIFGQKHHAIIIGRSTFPHKWDVLQQVSIFTSHYNYRQNHFFFKNGMFLSILAFYITLIVQTKQDSIIKWYEFVNVQLLHHVKNIDK